MGTVNVGYAGIPAENLAGYLKLHASGDHAPRRDPGFYSLHRNEPEGEVEAMRAAAKDLDEMIATWAPAKTS